VSGYSREEHTHLAVAAAVAAGRADTGMGILAAARAFGLGFVPVAKEPYDLVLRASTLAGCATGATVDAARPPRLPSRSGGARGLLVRGDGPPNPLMRALHGYRCIQSRATC